MQHVPRPSRLRGSAVRRALVTSAVVGSTLTLINQSVLLAGGLMKPSDFIRVGMNYVIPLLVALYSAHAAASGGAPRRQEHDGEPAAPAGPARPSDPMIVGEMQ